MTRGLVSGTRDRPPSGGGHRRRCDAPRVTAYRRDSVARRAASAAVAISPDGIMRTWVPLPTGSEPKTPPATRAGMDGLTESGELTAMSNLLHESTQQQTVALEHLRFIVPDRDPESVHDVALFDHAVGKAVCDQGL